MSPRRRLPTPPAPLVLPLPTAWGRERIEAARPHGAPPEYGCAQWHALADDDPRKLAAAVIAAEAHRYEAATLADRLARELDEARHAAAVADLHDAIADGARRAMCREARVQQLTAASVDSTVQRMTTAPFAEPRPVRDTVGWPWVRQPGAATRGEQLRLFAG